LVTTFSGGTRSILNVVVEATIDELLHPPEDMSSNLLSHRLIASPKSIGRLDFITELRSINMTSFLDASIHAPTILASTNQLRHGSQRLEDS